LTGFRSPHRPENKRKTAEIVAEVVLSRSKCKRIGGNALHANLGECEQAWSKGTTFNVFYDRARADLLRAQNIPNASFSRCEVAPFRAVQGLGTPGLYFGAENLLSANASLAGVDMCSKLAQMKAASRPTAAAWAANARASYLASSEATPTPHSSCSVFAASRDIPEAAGKLG
jgi:hypothetical protein